VNRSAVYVATAVVLGLVMMFVPILFFIRADEYGGDVFSVRDANSLPFSEKTGYNHIEAVSYEEVEILVLSFVIASMVYVLFKRKTSKHEHV